MPELQPVIDLTSIAPGTSGGVEAVAIGVASGLLGLNAVPRCLIVAGTASAWRHAFGEKIPELEEVQVSMRAGSRWQSRLRRALPPSFKTSRIVGAIRTMRSKSVATRSGSAPTWYPFHRSVAGAKTSIVTVHDLRVFEPELESTMDQRIISANIASATAIVCSWAHPYQHLIRLFPDAAKKTFLVPLPVLNPGPAPLRSLPDDGPVRLFFPGAITPHKNHEAIIRALALRPNFVLICTGSIVATHLSYLKNLAEQLGVSSRVEWRGYVSATQLEQEYRRAHVLVMPSRWEAASGPIFEAVVRELPFIASDIAPISAQLESLGIAAPTFAWNEPTEAARALDEVTSSYGHYRAQLAKPAEALRARTWLHTSREYLDVFKWASETGPKPVHLQ